MSKHPFMQRVDAYRAAGVERAKAFAKARNDDPVGYQDYLDRHNERYGDMNKSSLSRYCLRRAAAR